MDVSHTLWLCAIRDGGGVGMDFRKFVTDIPIMHVSDSESR
jgi:hypothetical protein